MLPKIARKAPILFDNKNIWVRSVACTATANTGIDNKFAKKVFLDESAAESGAMGDTCQALSTLTEASCFPLN